MRALPSFVLAVMIVLAGCNGVSIGGDEPQRATVAPADIPEDDSGTIAPGVTKNERINSHALMDAHRAVVANKSITVNRTVRSVAGNGTGLVRMNATNRYGANRTRYVRTTNIKQEHRERDFYPVDRMASWSNGDVQYRMVQQNGTRTYNVTEPFVQMQHQSGYLRDLLNKTTNITVEKLSKDGDLNRYRVQSELYLSNAGSTSVESTTRQMGDLSMIVDERGFIHRYIFESGEQRSANTKRIIQTVRYQNLTTTSIERPAWVAEAKNATENSTIGERKTETKRGQTPTVSDG